MCLGSKPPKDNSAEIARQNEEARQAKILAGQKSIDDTFGGTFNDGYFDKLASDYESYYNPQLVSQYDDALKELTFQTARGGNAESTAANDLFAKLEKQKQDAATKIANDARAAAGKARGDVAAEKRLWCVAQRQLQQLLDRHGTQRSPLDRNLCDGQVVCGGVPPHNVRRVLELRLHLIVCERNRLVDDRLTAQSVRPHWRAPQAKNCFMRTGTHQSKATSTNARPSPALRCTRTHR
jgi:hypothetical protein